MSPSASSETIVFSFKPFTINLLISSCCGTRSSHPIFPVNPDSISILLSAGSLIPLLNVLPFHLSSPCFHRNIPDVQVLCAASMTACSSGLSFLLRRSSAALILSGSPSFAFLSTTCTYSFLFIPRLAAHSGTLSASNSACESVLPFGTFASGKIFLSAFHGAHATFQTHSIAF